MEAMVTVHPPARGAAGGTTHVILAVTDDGVPSLTAYRRMILDVDDPK